MSETKDPNLKIWVQYRGGVGVVGCRNSCSDPGSPIGRQSLLQDTMKSSGFYS